MVILVPFKAAAGTTLPTTPFFINSSAPSSFLILEIIFTSDTDAILASASPRKPREFILNISSKTLILLVLKRSKATGNSLLLIPDPLSET